MKLEWVPGRSGATKRLRSTDNRYMVVPTRDDNDEPDGAVWFRRDSDACWVQGGDTETVDAAQGQCARHAGLV